MRQFYLFWLLVITLDVAVVAEPWVYVLFGAEVLACIILYVQAQLMWNGTEVSFPDKARMLVDWRKTDLNIKLSRGDKKVSRRAAVKLRMGYRQEKRKRAQKIYCGVSRIGEVQFGTMIPYCGLVQLEMERFWITDRLMVFFVGRKRTDSMQLFVVPGESALNIECADVERSGDSSKAYLKLDLTDLQEVDQRELGAFYSLLSATVLGLLKCVSAVQVSWYDEWKQRSFCMEVTELKECRRMLVALYRTGLPSEDETPEDAGVQVEAPDGQDFSLDLQLRWYRNDQLIYQFSPFKLSEEMGKKTFAI